MAPIALLMLICLFLSQGNCEDKVKKEEAKEATDAVTDVGERILQVLPGPSPDQQPPQITNLGSFGLNKPAAPQVPSLLQAGLLGSGNFEGLESQLLADNVGKNPLLLYPQNYAKYPTRGLQIDPLRQQRYYQHPNQNLFAPPKPRPHFQRYRSMFKVPEPGIANIGNLGFPLLSHFDEAKAPTPEDFEDPTLLLPKCNDHIPGCNRMRYIIELFNKNETNRISQDMKEENFPTRGILLREILQQLMGTELEDDVMSKVKDYAKQMEDQPSAPILEPVYKNLVRALPEPKNEIEKVTYGELSNWLTKTDLTLQLGQDFVPYPHKTKASLLRHIIQRGLQDSELSESLKDAMEYWGQRIVNFGRGAEPVDWVIVLKKVTRHTVDMRTTVKLLDEKKMESEENKKILKEINEFFEDDFNPEIHMVGLNIMKYKTKGELLTAFVQNILKKKDLDPDIRKNFEAAKHFIQLDGPGKEPVEYIK